MAQSPCKGICQPADGGVCVGCGRNLHEITHWNSMSDTEKQAVLDRLPRRLEKLARMGLLPKHLKPKPSA